VRRVWEGDGRLWSYDADVSELCANRLGWVRLPETMREHVPALRALAEQAVADGITDVVLCGMGGSSLAPEVLAAVFGPAKGHPDLHVVDTTDPRSVRAVTESVDLATALVIVASKSGGTIETDALRRHFTAALGAAGRDPGPHLIAITDAGSALHARAEEEGWRACFLNPADVGGRYSALSLFGLVPAALLGIDVERLLDAGAAEADSCRPGPPGTPCEAVKLGSSMGALAGLGVDKLSLRASPSLACFGDWVEQLVAESTGKMGPSGAVGVLPVLGEPDDAAAGADRFVVTLERLGEECPAAPPENVPHAHIRVRDPYELGGLFWRFEMATALAAAVLSIEPFDQPDVASAKAATNAVLASGDAPGEADSPDDLAAALDAVPEGGYVAVLSYLPRSVDADAAVDELADAIRARTGRAVTTGVGPRYLHSTGQLHKGGPANGVFVLLEGADPTGTDDDLPVPGRGESFGRLFSAQAEGDARTLRDRGRPLVRLRAGGDVAADVRAWAASLSR
jgi:glucose-6-phosphate isomerase